MADQSTTPTATADPSVAPIDLWVKTDLPAGLRQDLWTCTEPRCSDLLSGMVPDAERAAHRAKYHDARAETGDCGECNRPDQFAWDLIEWIDDAPIITCILHRDRAPGWAYDLDVEVASGA